MIYSYVGVFLGSVGKMFAFYAEYNETSFHGSFKDLTKIMRKHIKL